MKDITINEREQCYEIAGADRLGFDECIERIERYSMELAARGSLPELFIDAPVTAQRGTMEAYRTMTLLERDLIEVVTAADDVAMADLSIDLMGLEGHVVDVVSHGGHETYRFVVGRTDGPIPTHLEIDSDSDGTRVAERRYDSVVDLGIAAKS